MNYNKKKILEIDQLSFHVISLIASVLISPNNPVSRVNVVSDWAT